MEIEEVDWMSDDIGYLVGAINRGALTGGVPPPVQWRVISLEEWIGEQNGSASEVSEIEGEEGEKGGASGDQSHSAEGEDQKVQGGDADTDDEQRRESEGKIHEEGVERM